MSLTGGLNFGGMSTGVFGTQMPASGASSRPSPFSFSDSSGVWQKPAICGFGSTTQSTPFGISFQQQSQPAFGASSTPAFGNTGSGCGTSVNGSSTPAFGASSTPPFAESSTPAFDASSTPAFGNTCSAFGTSVNGSSTPAFGASITPPFAASSTPAFGVSSTPASGASSTPPLAGSSLVWPKPSSGGGFGSPTQSSPFGSSFQQQSQPAFGVSSTPAFGATSTSAFGASSTPAFGTSAFGAPSTPAFGASSTPAFGNPGSAFGTPVFGSSTPDFGGSSTPAFGAPSTPAFSATSTSAFGATSTPSFGNTGSAFGTSGFGSSTPVFGAASTPAFGASSTHAFGATSTPAFGSTGSAFGAPSTPAFGASSTPAFGATSTPAFGASSTPAFGTFSTPAFGCPPTNTFRSFSFEPQTSAPSFWSHGFGQPSFRGQLREGTRVTTYAQTADNYDYNLFPFGSKLKSISAMPAYKQKSQEELRWEDYKLGDKGNMLFHYPPVFWNVALGSSPFGVAFGPTPAFGTATFGCPYCRPISSAFGTSTSTFGTQAQGKTSLFGTGFNNGSTQSSSLFQSPTPTFGQTSFPFFGEPSSMEVDQKTPPISTFFQSTQPTQNTGCFRFSPVGTSGVFAQNVCRNAFCSQCQRLTNSRQDISRNRFSGQSPTSSNFGQDISRNPFSEQSSTPSQQPDTSPFGTLPTMQVDDKHFPTMKSCLLNTLQQIAKKYPDITFSFSDVKETASTKPSFGDIPFGGQKRAGTRETPYARTPEADSGTGTQPAGKVESISAMSAYKEKNHEELRWEDYQLGSKVYIHCGFNMNNTQQQHRNPFAPSSSFGNSQPFPLFQSTAPAFG